MYAGTRSPGMVRQVRIPPQILMLNYVNLPVRCLAPNDALGGPEDMLRRTDHTQTIIEEFEILECWDNWGIISDVVVCMLSIFLSVLLFCSFSSIPSSTDILSSGRLRFYCT